MDNDVIVYAVFTSIKPGLGKSPCEFANKKERPDARSTFVSLFLSQNPKPVWFWRPFSAKYHSFTQELALITNFKKVDAPDMKNLTEGKYHNT